MNTHKEICLICWNIPMDLMAKLIYGKINQIDMKMIIDRVKGASSCE